MWAFHLTLFEIVRPRIFTLVTASIGLLLIVTASKESADLEKLICDSLHLVSFNWNLSVKLGFHLVGPCGVSRPWMCHQHTSKGWRHWYLCHLSWPGRARAPIWSPAVHLTWLIPNPSSNCGQASLVSSCWCLFVLSYYSENEVGTNLNHHQFLLAPASGRNSCSPWAKTLKIGCSVSLRGTRAIIHFRNLQFL